LTPTSPSALPALDVDAGLRSTLRTLAAGRALVIGYYASRRCAVVTGDFTVSWRQPRSLDGFVEVPPIEDVAIVVDWRLLDLLSRAEPRLCPGGILSRGTPSIRLGRPELWLDYLDGPDGMRSRIPR